MAYMFRPQDFRLRQVIGEVEVEATVRIQLIDFRVEFVFEDSQEAAVETGEAQVIEVADSQEAAEAETQPAVLASGADASRRTCADRNVRRHSC